MTPHELLVKGRELISDEKRWTKGAFARDGNGHSLNPWNITAVCFCSIGALQRTHSKTDSTFHGAMAALDKAMSEDGVIYFNDTQTHSEVLAAWDRAIAASKAA